LSRTEKLITSLYISSYPGNEVVCKLFANCVRFVLLSCGVAGARVFFTEYRKAELWKFDKLKSTLIQTILW